MSALAPAALAIIGALEDDAELAAWTGATDDDRRVYRGLAITPGGRYVTVFTAPESPRDVFDADGFQSEVQARAWVPGDDTVEAAVGYGHIHRILHRRTLVMDGLTTISCEVSLRRVQTDPDGAASQAVAVIAVRSVSQMEAAA